MSTEAVSMAVTGESGALPAIKCAGCSVVFTPKRATQEHHSGACYDRDYNRRHPVVRAGKERQLALARVERHADPAWLEAAYQALLRCARALPSFISDDVWTYGLEQTREARALGPVLQRASKAGLIVKTDRVRPSVRSHLSGKPVWESRIYGSRA